MRLLGKEQCTGNINIKDEFRISNTLTNAVSWRTPGIKYSNNEIFLDVYEKLNMLISSKGQVIKSEIIGQIKVTFYRFNNFIGQMLFKWYA